MDCVQTTPLSDTEYFREFNRKVAELRVPVFGSIDLTHRCNLRCVHCYLGPHAPSQEQRRRELDAGQFTSIIDEVTEAGCLDLLLTGGEPLLREDFLEIYRYARAKGLLVTVFSNGTLITDEIAEVFADFPPRAVGITLYGATAATYERITGVKGSFERCLRGIQKLLNHKVRVDLRTILMTLNRHEFSDIEAMAKKYGIRFRFDAGIFPRFDGDRGPLELRVPPKEAVEKGFSDSERFRQRRDFFEKTRDLPVTDRLYKCSAGISTFHVDPYGSLRPCIMATEPAYNLLEGGFLRGWRDVIPRIREKKAPPDYRCNRCERITLCDYCPPFFELESGSEGAHSPYLCAITHYRYEAIKERDLLPGRGRETGGQDERRSRTANVQATL